MICTANGANGGQWEEDHALLDVIARQQEAVTAYGKEVRVRVARGAPGPISDSVERRAVRQSPGGRTSRFFSILAYLSLIYWSGSTRLRGACGRDQGYAL